MFADAPNRIKWVDVVGEHENSIVAILRRNKRQNTTHSNDQNSFVDINN